jgi:hypothetical protein
MCRIQSVIEGQWLGPLPNVQLRILSKPSLVPHLVLFPPLAQLSEPMSKKQPTSLVDQTQFAVTKFPIQATLPSRRYPFMPDLSQLLSLASSEFQQVLPTAFQIPERLQCVLFTSSPCRPTSDASLLVADAPVPLAQG